MSKHEAYEEVIGILERRLMVAKEATDNHAARGRTDLSWRYAARSVELEFALAEVKALQGEEAAQ